MTSEPEADVAVQMLKAVGWFEGRDAARMLDGWRSQLIEDGFELSSEAERALREFGGIRVRRRAPGINLARESFEIDPLLGLGGHDRFERFERILGVAPYPLGECGGGHDFLAIASDGRVFAVGDDEIHLAGGTAKEAILNLIRGLRGASVDDAP